MKNTEYRKGNLVEVSIYYDTDEAKDDLGDEYSEDQEWVVAKIASIENDLSEWDFSFETADGEYNRVREIPITKEWLKPYLYTHGLHGYFVANFPYRLYSSSVYQLVKIAESGRCTFNLSFQNGPNYFLRSIQYIHELQNLIFALTGKELELKKEVVS